MGALDADEAGLVATDGRPRHHQERTVVLVPAVHVVHPLLDGVDAVGEVLERQAYLVREGSGEFVYQFRLEGIHGAAEAVRYLQVAEEATLHVVLGYLIVLCFHN